jgi:phage replication-related protein YjqB (UPF0714/DUF867 family)
MEQHDLRDLAATHVHEYRSHDPDNTLAAIAPHGGAIEAHTARQAFHMAESLPQCSAWAFCGYAQGSETGAFELFHTPSTDIETDQLSLASTFLEADFDHIISFHGFEPETAVDVYLGGQIDRSVKRRVADHIQNTTGLSANVAAADDALYEQYSGSDDSNLTNRWCRNGGLQVEQTKQAREGYSEEICEAISDIFS